MSEELRAEIMRLRAELNTRGDAAFREWSFQNAKITEAAAFLERHANKLDGFTRWDDEDDRHIEATAAECRAMAAKLRGET